jgi:hypothetical protein
VFLVVGRTNDGRLVGRGGNQSDMVCDEVFDPSLITAFTWPRDYPAPMQVGFASLPIITPAAKARRDLALPPPTQRASREGLRAGAEGRQGDHHQRRAGRRCC